MGRGGVLYVLLRHSLGGGVSLKWRVASHAPTYYCKTVPRLILRLPMPIDVGACGLLGVAYDPIATEGIQGARPCWDWERNFLSRASRVEGLLHLLNSPSCSRLSRVGVGRALRSSELCLTLVDAQSSS